MKQGYQPKTGARCSCKRGVQRDNCPACEGTGWLIDFAAIRARRVKPEPSIDVLRGQVGGLRQALKVALGSAQAIMECNGYRSRDAMGTENSVWLGPRLSNITITARAALAATAPTTEQEDAHE